MIYILVVIGLALIYIGLKFDKRSHNKEQFRSFIPGNADIDKLKELEESVKYLSIRMDDVESALLIIDDRMYEIKCMCEDIDSKENKLKNENIKELSSIEKKVEKSTEELENKNDINNIVYNLYDSGKSIEEIASQLRIGKGEVSLRLGLRK